MNMKKLHSFLPSAPLRISILATSLLLVASCASTPPPTSQMAVAEAAVQTANNSNTSEHAPRELQVAVSKLASARQALERKDYEQARKLAEQAEIDAQVARVRAEAVSAGIAARESEEAARVLREELNRTSN